MKQRTGTITCNMCGKPIYQFDKEREPQKSPGVGVFWGVHVNAWTTKITFGEIQKADKHLCLECLDGIADMAEAVYERRLEVDEDY